MSKAKTHLIRPDMGGQHTNGGPGTYCRERNPGPNLMVGCGQWPRATCVGCIEEFYTGVCVRRLALADK